MAAAVAAAVSVPVAAVAVALESAIVEESVDVAAVAVSDDDDGVNVHSSMRLFSHPTISVLPPAMTSRNMHVSIHLHKSVCTM